MGCGQAKFQLCPINIKEYEDDDDTHFDDDAYYNGVCDGDHGDHLRYLTSSILT